MSLRSRKQAELIQRALEAEDRLQTKPLCDRCTKIDIDHAARWPCTAASDLVSVLGRISGDGGSGCPLCRLLLAVCVLQEERRGHATKVYQLRAFQAPKVCGQSELDQRQVPAELGTAFGVCWGSNKVVSREQHRRCLTKGFIAPLQQHGREAPRHPYQVHQVDRSAADYNMMRLWLNKCERMHTESCGFATSRRPPGFKCIDVDMIDVDQEFVDSKCVKTVSIRSNERYLALSYVWKEPKVAANAEDAGAEGQTTSKTKCAKSLKQVIQDAIKVARELGFKWLWVDEFCIDQKDPAQMNDQIRAMDRIYEGAVATIIAAPTIGCGPGLPGVSRPRASQQPVEIIGTQTWTSTLPHLSVAVATSTWVTRGWTYQEAVLSRRCLYFTDEQVYFLCRSGTARESIPGGDDTAMESLGLRDFRTYPFDTDLTNPSLSRMGLWGFFENLHLYKRRQLTWDADSLSALQGLLVRSNFVTIWGVPIAHTTQNSNHLDEKNLAIGFARGLWWENPGHPTRDLAHINKKYVNLTRRSEFPSWSWTAWNGPTRLHSFYGDQFSDTACNEINEMAFDTKFWVELQNGEHIPLSRAMREDNSQFSFSLHIEAWIAKVKIRRHPARSNPMAYVCECPIDEPCRAFHDTKVHNIRLFEDPAKDESWTTRLFSEFWYAVPLFKTRDQDSECTIVASLMVDWNPLVGSPASVIGVAYLDERFLQVKSRQKIEIV